MNNDWIKNKLRELDDEAFIDVVEELATRSANTEVKRNDELISIIEIEEEIDKVYDTWGKPSGLKTGFPLLDTKIGGLKRGEITLIGGETSNGKSALAANIACNVAKEHCVLFITLEMLQSEIGARLKHINGGKIDDLNILFQAEYRIDYKDLEPIIQKAKTKGDVDMVILDYMQYLGRGMKVDEVARMSKEFKSLALKYEIPFVVIVSLRKADNKAKRNWVDIEIEEFMGTGAIGYDADVAMIVSRKDTENEFQLDKVFVKILKTRNNKLDWNDRILTFNWDDTKITQPALTWVKK
jgi:replicative DNA helicase